jgi:hypothetical protein
MGLGPFLTDSATIGASRGKFGKSFQKDVSRWQRRSQDGATPAGAASRCPAPAR